MAMRNPPVSDVLRRRLFMTASPYTRRDAAGIMASSSPLMEAVMRQQNPASNLVLTGSSMPNLLEGAGRTVEDFQTTLPTMPDESDPQGGAGGETLPPPASSSPDVVGNITPKPKSPAPAAPKPRPKTEDTSTTTVTSLSSYSLKEMMEALKTNKTADEFIKDNKALLEKYAPLPKKKNLQREYLTKFFLDMAARGAQGDAPLEAAATAAPGTFDEYLEAKDKRTTQESERELLALTMGIQDKKTQDAANQAINLKVLELQERPDKLKILDGLVSDAMGKGSSYSEAYQQALRQVFPDAKPGATALQIAGLKSLGHSDGIAALILNARLLEDNKTNPSYFLNYLTMPQVVANQTDAAFLLSQAQRAGAGVEAINAALNEAGYTLTPDGTIVPLGTN